MASKYLQLFPIPNTLPHVVRDLTREILRYQPQDIIQFCAFYFRAKKNNLEFVWNEEHPRAPRPADYKKQSNNEPVEARKAQKIEKNQENSAKTSNPQTIKHQNVEKVNKHENKEQENKVNSEKHEKAGKMIKNQDKHEERKVEISQKNRDIKSGSDTRTNEISGISSLPENVDEAAGVYVEGLLDKVQKHIEAAT